MSLIVYQLSVCNFQDLKNNFQKFFLMFLRNHWTRFRKLINKKKVFPVL